MRLKNRISILSIVGSFLVIYFLTSLKFFLVFAIITGFLGLSSDYIANKILFIWGKLTHIIGAVLSTILLTITFYLVLTPLALLSKLFRKDPLKKSRTESSLFMNYEVNFNEEYFERLW